MPSSGYAAITFVANEQPTTAKWNLIGSNDSSFNLGTGLEDNVILDRHIATGNLKTTKFSNPSKFLLGRNAAYTLPSTFNPVAFDTKIFDTGSNVDVSVHLGRFTAPVAGFYRFEAATIANLTSGDHAYGGIAKNGTEAHRLFEHTASSTTNMTWGGASPPMQLAAGDYIEFGVSYPASRSVLTSPIAAYCWFGGELISST